ncbi:MAG: ABC transporter ATP-binding protein [Clostridiales Family XIII bacterium]|jgi:oligopeptide/dipeptide ABC transporter ATP-binding protein|nr:ABC transporter ATP-binding protein [Clostridiales Family XIII bacterium]
MPGNVILEIKNLHVYYLTETETAKAVRGVNLEIRAGESVGLVGETGAGKTTTCLSVMRLVPDPPGVIVDGEINFKGENLIFADEKRCRAIRGEGISMIFQDPMTALNPVMTVGEQLMEVVREHNKKLSKAEAKALVIRSLERVGVKGDRFNDYPHQFSGGMKQRVIITMALLCEPELLIADEPTTALDVTIQAQVLDIIRGLQRETGASMLLVTHDLGVVAETCDRVAIMYAGNIVELGTVKEVFRNKRHPYTEGLFNSIPRLENENRRLMPIDGLPPNPADLPEGCAFHPRCRRRLPICEREAPPMKGEGHIYACHL